MFTAWPNINNEAGQQSQTHSLNHIREAEIEFPGSCIKLEAFLHNDMRGF